MHYLFIAFLILASIACNQTSLSDSSSTEVKAVATMKDVMWKGELGSKIDLDTISNKEGLYGIGPLTYLKGELMIYDGKSYLSYAGGDSSMNVSESFEASAPFFVYANVIGWEEIDLPDGILSIKELEHFIDSINKERNEPFVFKMEGKVSMAKFHLQNLPEDTKVSSPKEAHQGQLNFNINDRVVKIVGFFSRNHQGVFTHHDSYMHLHLLTEDAKMMGHLDAMEISSMRLYISI